MVLVVVGGEGTGSLRLAGASLQSLVDDTYSECGSNVIASVGIFAAQLPSGNYSMSLTSTTFGANSGASLGAVAYILTPT